MTRDFRLHTYGPCLLCRISIDYNSFKICFNVFFSGEYDAALKLHQAHLAIARSLQDRAGMGRAYGNIGNAYSAAGFYESAIKYHKQELTISKEVHDRSSEASTHGNLAVAYQALGAHDMALLHYRAHLGK